MGPREIIIIAFIVLLLFGAPKLPMLARSIGKSLKILKEETKDLTGGSDDEAKSEATSSGSTRGESTVIEAESTIKDPADHKRES